MAEQKQEKQLEAPTLKLNTGALIPCVGYGLYLVDPKETYQAVTDALAVGYRHIDTAQFYANEAECGKAIRDSKIPRKDIFVTTKIWEHESEAGKVAKCTEERLKLLDIEYVDLMLIHAPIGGFNVKTFNELLKFQKKGLVKAVGVSNYSVDHLKALEKAGCPAPAVNQLELHAFRQCKDMMEYCKEKGIVVCAYSALAQGKVFKDPEKIKLVEAVAKNYPNKSVAQVILKWNTQVGNVILVKSTKKERMKANLDLFDFKISDEDMKTIESWDTDWNVCVNLMDGNAWNPKVIPVGDNEDW